MNWYVVLREVFSVHVSHKDEHIGLRRGSVIQFAGKPCFLGHAEKHNIHKIVLDPDRKEERFIAAPCEKIADGFLLVPASCLSAPFASEDNLWIVELPRKNQKDLTLLHCGTETDRKNANTATLAQNLRMSEDEVREHRNSLVLSWNERKEQWYAPPHR